MGFRVENIQDKMRQCLSIYIHVPFCERKCNYCAFASFCASGQTIDEYIDVLCGEIRRRKCDRNVKTIYIGGGTPSLLSEKQIEKVVNCLYENFNIYDNAEFTIEANPNSITEEKLLMWKKLRVNRVSVGVQSLSDKSLKKIGRLHNHKMAIEKIKLTRKYFANVSVDLIVGLEGETGKDLSRYAMELLSLGVKHVSCYLLEVYENTNLFSMINSKKYKPLTDEETIEAFNKLSNYLVDKGMQRYEISNFAFEGFESKHNLNYWARGDYLGFGLGAHSFEGSRRYFNALTLDEYKLGIVEEENLTTEETLEEMIMLGLRCLLGVNVESLLKLGYDITKNEYYQDYLEQEIIKEEGGVVTLNPVYYHLSNTIITNLLP